MPDFKPLYNLKKLRELCDNDEQLIEESIKFFYDETIFNLSLMLAKLEKHDYEEVRAIAHRVKVNFVFISCEVCVEICKKIKLTHDNVEIEELVYNLKREYFNVFQQLKKEFSQVVNYDDISNFKSIN